MEAIVSLDRAMIAGPEEENQTAVREVVMESYRDMLDGKGRDHREFFAELEERYNRAKV